MSKKYCVYCAYIKINFLNEFIKIIKTEKPNVK